jgi:hypothetical protein
VETGAPVRLLVIVKLRLAPDQGDAAEIVQGSGKFGIERKCAAAGVNRLVEATGEPVHLA